MSPTEALQEINACFSDWEGLVANKNATLRRKLLAWPNYTPTIQERVTAETVTELASNKQYTLQIVDGSVVQMLYDFSGKGDALNSATLAYYENVRQEDAEEEDGDVLPLDESDEQSPPKWLRLDYTNLEEGNCIHSACHLHLAGFPDTRIGCAGVPGPRQFIESLLAWFYPERYRESVLIMETEDKKRRFTDVNRVCHPLTSNDEHNSLIHLNLPPSVRFPRENPKIPAD